LKFLVITYISTTTVGQVILDPLEIDGQSCRRNELSTMTPTASGSPIYVRVKGIWINAGADISSIYTFLLKLHALPPGTGDPTTLPTRQHHFWRISAVILVHICSSAHIAYMKV